MVIASYFATNANWRKIAVASLLSVQYLRLLLILDSMQDLVQYEWYLLKKVALQSCY